MRTPKQSNGSQSDSASTTVSRRSFVRSATASAAAAGFFPVPTIARGRLEKPTLLGIGAGGKGKTDLEKCTQAGFDVVALCDVVDIRKFDGSLEGKNGKRLKALNTVRDSYPTAVFGTDYREMIEQLGDKIDGVVVATPDHHHFHASVQAMQAGKHVYCQKPLTHGIWEARMMTEVAERTGVKTQMGNQAHAHDHMRRCVELIRAGVIGKVSAVHTWTNRPIWPQGFGQAPTSEKIPAGLDWQQWIGPAPATDYSPVIAPFAWRGWWDFGTGALGDMACHIMDLGFWSLNPQAPRAVQAEQSGATEISPPINSKIVWKFGPTEFTADKGFAIHWYDGYVDAEFERATWELKKHSDEYNHPDEKVLSGRSFKDFGSVIVGERGKLFFNRSHKKDGASWFLQTNSGIDEFDWPEASLPRARQQDNYIEWYDAIQGDIAKCESNFAHAGPFTETILLGVLAQRASAMQGGQRQQLKWDAEAMKVVGHPEYDSLVRRPYADGWQLEPQSS